MIDQKQKEFLQEFWAIRLRKSTEYLQKHPDNERACKDNFRALHALEILGIRL